MPDTLEQKTSTVDDTTHTEKNQSPKKPSEEKDGKNYASFNARMLSAMIDSVLSLIPLIILGTAAETLLPPLPQSLMMKLDSGQPISPEELELIYQQAIIASGGALSQFFIVSVIVTVFWIYFAATPGKMLLGMKIIDQETGKNPGIWQSLLRVLGYIVSTVPIMLGFFWIHFDKKSQGWHDKFAGTIVVYTDNSIYHRVAKKYARLLSGRKE